MKTASRQTGLGWRAMVRIVPSLTSYGGSRPIVTATNQAPLARTLSSLLDTLLPRPCLACRDHHSSSAIGLCLRCRSAVRHSRSGRCRSCGLDVPALAGRLDEACGPCQRRPPALDRLFFLYDYRAPIDSVIHGLKYQKLEYLARPLAAELFDRFAERLVHYDLVVPIPLHRWRQWRRGFNQAEALAVPLARRLGRPRRRLLRHRRGKAQSVLDHSERAANARHVLRLGPRVELSGERVLLVDDVTTTGATLNAAARLLKRAGAETVAAAVAARTPEPGTPTRMPATATTAAPPGEPAK